MKLRIISVAFCVAASLSAPATAATFTSYFAFGDSLTDDGKLDLPLPYDEGRFSSGPVWAEYIEDIFAAAGRLTDNFALGGATAGDRNLNTAFYPEEVRQLGTFNGQIDAFEDNAKSAALGVNPLVSVLFGANDIFQGGDPVEAAKAVGAGLERIANLSDVFDNFLVSTLPALGGGDAEPAIAFNQQLDLELKALIDGGVTVTLIDQLAFQADLAPRLFDLGIRQLDEPCIALPSDDTPGRDCTIIGVDGDGNLLRDLDIADTYFLIDDVHPSGPIQQAFGEYAIALIEDDLPAPIPLPAGLPLMLGGLGALGLMARRRAA